MDNLKDQEGTLLCSKYFYGSKYKDEYLFKNPVSLPRYGHLARKALLHYAGEHYNPHTICITQEPFIRLLIKGFIEYKVFYKLKSYDWEVIDHFFRKVIGEYYNLDLKHDISVIERGFSPEFRAPHLIDYSKRI